MPRYRVANRHFRSLQSKWQADQALRQDNGGYVRLPELPVTVGVSATDLNRPMLDRARSVYAS
jgi:hypothetical protein